MECHERTGAGPSGRYRLSLIRYICERIGIRDPSSLDILDFECGIRYADTIVNRHVQLKTYVGIDVLKPLIDPFWSDDPRVQWGDPW
jgi:hypothetical protein